MNPTYKFTYPDNLTTFHIFYQGNNGAAEQALRYLDEREFLLPTGEVYTRPDAAIGLMNREHLWIYPQLSEVITTAKVPPDYKQTGIVLKKPYLPAYPLDIPGSMINYSIDNNQCSLGQDSDIENHKSRYNHLQQYLTRKNITSYNISLFGVSRGAATTFSALAENKDNYQNIKLCVIEGPPSSLMHIFKFQAGIVFARPLYFLARKLGFLGWQHKSDKSKQAIGHADAFPDNIPLVVVSSQKDKLVPISSALKLALRVAVNRKKKKISTPVYFIQLENADHNDYAIDKNDSERYQQNLHAIYRRHNLAYVESLANAGESKLFSCNLLNHPALADQERFWNDKANRKEIRRDALNSLLFNLNGKAIISDFENAVSQLKTARFMPLFAKHRHPIKRTLPALVATIPTASQLEIDKVIKSRIRAQC